MAERRRTRPVQKERKERKRRQTGREQAAPAGTARAAETVKDAGQPGKHLLAQDIQLLLLKIAILAVMAAILFLFVFGIARCSDASMFPAVKDGDLAVYYRADKDYMQGDVVVLEADGKTQIRRVVAVEGDTVDVTEDGLFINGALQQENNIYEETQRYQEGIDFPVTLGEDEIFVLGDAREHSTDSRIYGPVNAKDTKGTVITLIRRRGI